MDVLTHALVPALALAAAGLPLRKAALGGLLGVVPDLDAFVGTHRVLLHNVLALALVAGALALALRRRHADVAGVVGIVAFGWASHLALDLPTGIALGYPFTTLSPYWSLQAFHEIGGGPLALRFALDAGALPAPPTTWNPISLSEPGPSSVRAVSSFAVMTALVALVAQVAFNPAVGRVAAALRARWSRSVEGPE